MPVRFPALLSLPPLSFSLCLSPCPLSNNNLIRVPGWEQRKQSPRHLRSSPNQCFSPAVPRREASNCRQKLCLSREAAKLCSDKLICVPYAQTGLAFLTFFLLLSSSFKKDAKFQNNDALHKMFLAPRMLFPVFWATQEVDIYQERRKRGGAVTPERDTCRLRCFFFFSLIYSIRTRGRTENRKKTAHACVAPALSVRSSSIRWHPKSLHLS